MKNRLIRQIAAIAMLALLPLNIYGDEETPDTPQEPFTQEDLSVLTGNVQRPNGAQWFNDNLYMVCNGDWTVYEIDDSDGSTQTYIYGVRNAHTVFIEATSETSFDLWIPDFEQNSLLQVNQAGAPRVINTELEGPWGIAYIDNAHFLISNLLGNSIVVAGRDGSLSTVIEGLRSPAGLVYDTERIYFANNASTRRSIEWFTWRIDEETTESNIEVATLITGLQSTTGLVLGADGLLYFSYAIGTRGVVGRVDPQVCIDNGGCTVNDTETVVVTELAAPLSGLTLSPDMRLFFHTIYRPEIYWVQLDTEVVHSRSD